MICAVAVAATAFVMLPSVLAAQAAPAAAPQSEPPRVQPLDRVVAVVDQRAILLSEVLEEVNVLRQQGQPMPNDSIGQHNMLMKVINDLIDNEVVVVVARQYKAEVSDEDVARQVDDQFNRVRGNFQGEPEFREAIRREGFGTPEDYRRTLREQAKRYRLQQLGYDSLRAHGRLSAPVQVTEAEVSAAFEASKDKLPRRPATVAFRQIVIPPRPSAAAKAVAHAKADSLLKEIQDGADFATVARRESMDPGSKDLGGDLGWARRGSGFVPEFERAIFSLPPGRLVVVETVFGYHVLRVDRVQPAEVKSRHVLITPKLDSTDVARARGLADSVLAKWRSGVAYDSLAALYHDPAEERTVLDGWAVDSLPEVYKSAVEGIAAREFTKPFEIPDARSGFPKYGILQITERSEGGDYTVADLRSRIRSQLVQEKQIRRMLDQLRREHYVRVLFGAAEPATKPAP